MKPEDQKSALLSQIRGILKRAAKAIPKEDEDGEDWYELLLEELADCCATDAHDFDRPDQPEDDEDEDDDDSWVEDEDDDSDLE